MDTWQRQGKTYVILLVVQVALLAGPALADEAVECTIDRWGSLVGATILDDLGVPVGSGTDVQVRFSRAGVPDQIVGVVAQTGGRIALTAPPAFAGQPFDFAVDAGGTPGGTIGVIQSSSVVDGLTGTIAPIGLIPFVPTAGPTQLHLMDEGGGLPTSITVRWQQNERPDLYSWLVYESSLLLDVTLAPAGADRWEVALDQGAVALWGNFLHRVPPYEEQILMFDLEPGAIGWIDTGVDAFDLTLTSRGCQIIKEPAPYICPWDVQGTWGVSGSLYDMGGEVMLLGPMQGFVIPEPATLCLLALGGVVALRRQKRRQ